MACTVEVGELEYTHQDDTEDVATGGQYQQLGA